MSGKSIILTVCGVGAEMLAVRGGIDANFGCDNRSNNYLCFSDGTVLHSYYHNETAQWRFVALELGQAECAGEVEGAGGFINVASLGDTMLDAVSVRGTIRWVAHGTGYAAPGGLPTIPAWRRGDGNDPD